MARVFDCFPFFNEFDVLRIRLRELRDVVDRFVLVEASMTHAGRPKPLYFRESRDMFFSEWSDRIVHRAIDFPPADTWGRENLQRLAILDVLADLGAEPDDVVISSDVDEISRASAVRAYLDGGRADACCVEQVVYHYDLGCVLETPTLDPKICRYATMRAEGPVNLRYRHQAFPDMPIIENGGWHLSFMGGTAKIIEKLGAYAHHDDSDPRTPAYASVENVEASVRERRSLFMRDDVRYRRPSDAERGDLPQFIGENRHYFIERGWFRDAD